ncbi:MAG TPA: hypothetical protein VM223_16665, partial [Planctomycetota bacterium]|nr:hypothetical protein [Planctomycetota bacterium]
KQSKEGLAILVAAIGMGIQEKRDSSSSCISRVRFSLPIGLPCQTSQKVDVIGDPRPKENHA